MSVTNVTPVIANNVPSVVEEDDATNNGSYLSQKTVTGRVKTNKRGAEILSFYLNLGSWRLVCIANIPEEGSSEAPVYIKMTDNTAFGEPDNGSLFLSQKTVTGRVKTNSRGAEILTAYLNLGPWRIVFIANIPADGETEAPVYCKMTDNAAFNGQVPGNAASNE